MKKLLLATAIMAATAGTGYTTGSQLEQRVDRDYPGRIFRKAEPLMVERLRQREEKDPEITDCRGCEGKEKINDAISRLDSVDCPLPGIGSWGQIVRKTVRNIVARDEEGFCRILNGETKPFTAMVMPEESSIDVCIKEKDRWKLATTILHEAIHNIPLVTFGEMEEESTRTYMELFGVPKKEQAYEALAFSGVICFVDGYNRQTKEIPWYRMVFSDNLEHIKRNAYQKLDDVKAGTYGIHL